MGAAAGRWAYCCSECMRWADMGCPAGGSSCSAAVLAAWLGQASPGAVVSAALREWHPTEVRHALCAAVLPWCGGGAELQSFHCGMVSCWTSCRPAAGIRGTCTGSCALGQWALPPWHLTMRTPSAARATRGIPLTLPSGRRPSLGSPSGNPPGGRADQVGLPCAEA